MYTVITENDESQWSDDEGALYHFPKRYLKHLSPGTNVIYYKGKLRNKKFSELRLTDSPHYFGTAVIGRIYPDLNSSKNDLFATIESFKKFTNPVLAKHMEGYYETIPESRKNNYWRDGVRPINKEIHHSIVSNLSSSDIVEPIEKNSTDDYDYESGDEGKKGQRYVTVYERNSKLRRQAIAIHGTTCFACGFNFRNFYGPYADGFIHIHHVKPISENGGIITVNPETDLLPLCANCHSVVHRKKNKTLTISDLKEMIANPTPAS